MASRRQPLGQIEAVLVLAMMVLLPTAPVRAGSQAAIRATAHVEAPLGLIDARIEPAGRNCDTLPGSHLYWLYYPHQGGVQIQISRPGDESEADSLPPGRVLSRFFPEVLREYARAALVDLGPRGLSGDGDTGCITLTLIFVDN